jgi:two-component system, OmpR family, KDP operon response regulator KdpE
MSGAPEKAPIILVIDDEEQIRRALTSILSVRKYKVVCAADGPTGIEAAVEHTPDLVILDLAMPGLSGMQVCQELRTWLSAPILVLSVRDADQDKISALDVGADDYLTKPFSAGELLARVRALLRRTAGQSAPLPVINAGELEIDLAQRRVRRGGEEIELTRIEFDILVCLAQNPDRIVTYKMLVEKVWGPEFGPDTQALRVHISHLRKKLETHPSVPRYIITEPGVGFRFNAKVI